MREMKDSGVEWIGEIPKDKKVLRNKYMFSYEKGKLPSSTNMDKKGFAYIGASDLDSNKSEYTTYTEDVTLPNAEYNDLLVLWDGARAGLCGTHKIGKLSSTIVRIKADKTVYQPFLYWYYKGFESHMYQSVNGTTIPHMNRKYIENIGFIDWTIQEQQKLSAYLDTKCTKIDSIIEKQEKVIEKLKEYKLSVITEAVTKGITPNVKMKDSGVEWIGEIPEKWEFIKAKYCVLITNGSDPKTEGDIPVYGSGSSSFKTCGEFKEGPCVLIGRKGATLHIPHYIIGKYWNVDTAFDVKALDRVLLKYYYFLAICFDYKIFMSQTTLPSMTQTAYENMILPIPSIIEQADICNYLDKKCSAIDKSINQKQAIIEKLKEYKKSLIYEVVTGKREV